MDPAEFRRQAHALADWIATYLEQVERYPVVPRVAPGDDVPLGDVAVDHAAAQRAAAAAITGQKCQTM